MATHAHNTEAFLVRRIDTEARKEEQEQFGKEAEPVFVMFLEYIGRVKGVIASVRKGTEAEDHDMIDMVITLQNKMQIAVQLSFARDRDIQRQKLERMIERPIVGNLYDERGRRTPIEPIPRMLLSGSSPEVWKRIVECHKKGSPPEACLENPEAEAIFILEQFKRNLEFLSTRRPEHRQLFNNYISFLSDRMPEQPGKKHQMHAHRQA